ncbi:MAG: molybdopterin-dependent oxidoreductase [Theionarchaea archaeon]|nr:molybdopterin-dependent oxidoreductase [Theionarchaea archaeon]
MSTIETVCPRDCYDTCFVRVSIRDGDLIRTMGDKTNPVTQGFLCPRGYRDIERVYSDDRILYPHRRVSDSFERISWNDALSVLTEKLQNIMGTTGAESCLQLNCLGNQGLFTSYLPQRLFYALGFTQTDESICSKSGHDALSLHYGFTYGLNPDELSTMELTNYWGFNAAVSAPHLHRLSIKAQKDGGVVVVVDPRKSETAESADLWVKLTPGSDVALAYGILKQVIDNDSVDAGFIEQHTYGLDKLTEEISQWSTRSIEEYTGVHWGTVAELAELYSTHRQSTTMIGIGMQKSLYGAESVRAISLIPAVMGLHRGFYYSNAQAYYVDVPYITGKKLTDNPIRVVSQVALGRLLENGEFKFVYIHNMNPAHTLPNQEAVKKGLLRDDVFVVVHDTHWTETAHLADLVLPAPTYFEKEDIVIPYSHSYVRKSNQVIEPRGESKSELQVMEELAIRLHCKETWIYEDKWEALHNGLQNAFETGDISHIKRGELLTLKMKPKNEYQTPTGRIELYSATAEKMGVTPLPKQYPLPKSGFILLNTAVKNYTHTQFQDIYGAIPSLVFINLEDAKTHHIHDTDVIEVSSKLGSIKLKAVISTAVPRGVLWAPRQGKDIEGTPQNSIMPDTTQKIGGGPVFNSTVVTIRKL